MIKNKNIDIMCAKLEHQQVENMNLFTQNLANHLTMFLNRLEEVNKDKSILVTDAETNKHSGFNAIANNGDTQDSLSKAITNNGDENNKKKPNKHSLAVKDGENPRNKRKRPLSSLEGNTNTKIILTTVLVSISQISGKMYQIPIWMMITR